MQAKRKKVFEAYAATDIGLVRDTNEDSFIVDNNLGLFIVADGLGGHRGGEVASRLVVETITDYLKKTTEERLETNYLANINKAIRKAHEVIIKTSSGDLELSGMGSTLVMGLLDSEANLYIVNVGDSRAYLYRNHKLHLLTHDHSLAADLVREGNLRAEEIRFHPLRNTVTQFVGIDSFDAGYQEKIALRGSDIIILCSDGLWEMFSDKEIEEYATKEKGPRNLCHGLIDAAKTAGGKDNITVIIIEIKES